VKSQALRGLVCVTLWFLYSHVAGAAWAVTERPLPTPYGPLRLVNQHPVQLLFLQPFPDQTDVTPVHRLEAHLNTALTNSLLGDTQQVTANIDLEMVRSVLDLRYGVYPQLEVGLELPFMYTYDGILDTFILDVERLLTPGRERPIRKRQNAGSFAYQVARGNRRFVQGQDDAFSLGDMVLKAKVAVLQEQRSLPAVSLRAALKVPSGDTDRAFGSGGVDGSLGVLLQKTFWRVTVHVNGDVTFPSQSFDDAGVSLQPFFLGVLAMEVRLAPPVSLVMQLRGDTRPFHHTIPLLDKRLIETLLGVNWALSRQLVVQAGVAEDQFRSDCCSADVSFFLNLTGRW